MTTIDTDFSARATDQARIPLRDLARAVVDGFAAMVNTLLDWQERARQRRLLLGLSDHALHDFSANRADAAGEGDKPFWHA